MPEPRRAQRIAATLRLMVPGDYAELPTRTDNARGLVYQMRKRGELLDVSFKFRTLGERQAGVWCVAKDAAPSGDQQS